MNTIEKAIYLFIACILVFFLGAIISIAVGMEPTTIDTDVSKLKLRTWDLYAFLWLLFAYRANNTLKRQRWYPRFMCKIKTSKDGRYQYKKIKVKYFRVGSVFLFSIGVFYCWTELIGVRFEDIQQVLIASAVVGVNAQLIIGLAMSQLKKRAPEAHEILAEGLYKDRDDMTMVDKTMVYLVSGGGEDKRTEDRTQYLHPDKRAGENFDKPK